MFIFVSAYLSLVSAKCVESDKKLGPLYQCQYDVEGTQVLIGRGNEHVYVKAVSRDSRWLALGVGASMSKMIAFINHDDPQYVDQQSPYDTTLSYSAGTRKFEGHPQNFEGKVNATLPGVTPEEDFNKFTFSFGNSRVTEFWITQAKWEEEYNSSVVVAWGQDKDDREMNKYHGARKRVLTFNTDKDDEFTLPEVEDPELAAKNEERIFGRSGASLLGALSAAFLALSIYA